jgi:hypothetical protein
MTFERVLWWTTYNAARKGSVPLIIHQGIHKCVLVVPMEDCVFLPHDAKKVVTVDG